jgi:penicillin-binding protein 1C
MRKILHKNTVFLKRRRFFYLVLGILLTYILFRFVFLLPKELFKVPYSTVIEDNQGELLSAIIADDGQWRFPLTSDIPPRLKACILEFEDAEFYCHFGVNPKALLRASYQNIKHRRIKSGGSTITMQVVRLSRKRNERSFREKFIEILMAIRIEMSYSKEEILRMYVSHAPFGGNVVGIEAAAWRYYGIEPEQLSWGQAATLAVLPNAPSLIYPGKNDILLKQKRNRLLTKLFRKNYFSQNVYEAAIDEPLPGKPYPLPQDAIHLLNRAINDKKKGQRISSTIHKDLQLFVQQAVNNHSKMLSGNKVNNAAAIVIEVETGKVLAYAGNSTHTNAHQNQVDIINSKRSPGSTLKPLLYCAMLHDGELLPHTLIPDIPMILDGFNPQNYFRTYEGAVKASQALSRSLNVPSVHLLRQYGIEKFYHFLKKCGLTTFTEPASHYGLSMILGGGEVKLHELAGVYASMARILIRYNHDGSYSEEDIFAPYYDKNRKSKIEYASNIANAASIWFTFQSMIEVNRPEEDQFWFHFSSQTPVAWKTGTSYGERDAWAVGLTPKYVVGVWAGNATGEGRPGLTGLLAAAPLMFQIFDYLPNCQWFEKPMNSMAHLTICSQSGYKAGDFCLNTQVEYVPIQGIRTKTCPYHKQIHLDSTLQWQVHANCESVFNIITEKRFVLPPIMEYYYKMKNPFYKTLPPFREDCMNLELHTGFEIIYPTSNSKIYIIDEITGNQGQVVFRAAHRKSDATLYWHLNNDFIGSTKGKHTISVRPAKGKHTLTVVDHHGETRSCNFEILNRE